MSFAMKVNSTKNTQSPVQGSDIAIVSNLLVLGIIGSATNTVWLLSLLKPNNNNELSDAMKVLLTQSAISGILECCVNIVWSAFYVSGGHGEWKFSGIAYFPTFYSAILTSTLFTISTAAAWFLSFTIISSQSIIKSTAESKILSTFVWILCISLGIANAWLLSDNDYAISNTLIVPRVKVLNIPQALRYSNVVLGHGVPISIPLVSNLIYQTAKLVKPSAVSPTTTVINLNNVNGRRLNPNLIVTVLQYIFYMIFKFPFDLTSHISGTRSSRTHASLTWLRFVHPVITPLFMPYPKDNKKMFLELLKCLKKSFTNPETPAERKVSLVQPKYANIASTISPVIFPTTHGLFLRKSKGDPLNENSYMYVDQTN